tara:strand:+ start:12 stop:362 length:351 start_codon:yes stop_codon:yes gene_type:complete
MINGEDFGVLMNKPKIFKRDGRWQLCHPLLANSFNIALTPLAEYYCDRMNSKECDSGFLKYEWGYKHYLILPIISDARIINPKHHGYSYDSGIQDKGASFWRRIMNSLRLSAQGDL